MDNLLSLLQIYMKANGKYAELWIKQKDLFDAIDK